MIVMVVRNEGDKEIPLFDGIEYQKDDIIQFKDQPDVVYKVAARRFITSANTNCFVLKEPEEPHLLLEVIKGKMVSTK